MSSFSESLKVNSVVADSVTDSSAETLLASAAVTVSAAAAAPTIDVSSLLRSSGSTVLAVDASGGDCDGCALVCVSKTGAVVASSTDGGSKGINTIAIAAGVLTVTTDAVTGDIVATARRA